jgi:rubrerythrin
METLVLKGGNAMDLIYNVGTRASYDLDFSMEEDFKKDIEEIKSDIHNTLDITFNEAGYIVFDFQLNIKPKVIKDEVKDFWGGYEVLFKIIEIDKYKSLVGDTELEFNALNDKDKSKVRRNAIPLNPNQSNKFSIDISKHEYVEAKEAVSFEDYKIYIYPIQMLVLEKLRAICQQIPDYKEIIKTGSAKGRAKDFYDIYSLLTLFDIDISRSDKNKDLLRNIFDAKKVPYNFLKKIRDNKQLHLDSFVSVIDTVSPEERKNMKEFDFYFEYIVNIFEDFLESN